MTTTTTKRVHNFGAGPAVLPLPVLERVQAELLDYAGTGMSVLEMSHRSAAFEGIIQKAEADLRALVGLGPGPRRAVPAGRRLAAVRDGAGEPPRRGRLGRLRAVRPLVEGRAQGGAEAGPRARRGLDRGERLRPRPGAGRARPRPGAAYLHFTSNNTIYGTEWSTDPEPPAGVPLVCDASSDVLSRPFDVARLGLLYAGAQKNLGPAGVTLVVVRRDLLERVPGRPAGAARLPPHGREPLALQHAAHLRDLRRRPRARVAARARAGSARSASATRRRPRSSTRRSTAATASTAGTPSPASRSRMNVTFRLRDEELEKAFLKQAQAEGSTASRGTARSAGCARRSTTPARSSRWRRSPPSWTSSAAAAADALAGPALRGLGWSEADPGLRALRRPGPRARAASSGATPGTCACARRRARASPAGRAPAPRGARARACPRSGTGWRCARPRRDSARSSRPCCRGARPSSAARPGTARSRRCWRPTSTPSSW